MKFKIIFLWVLLSTTLVHAQLTPQQWQADLAVLKRILPEQHPFLFDRMSKKEFEQSIEQLFATLPKLNNLQAALSVQAILAKAKDINTYADLRTFMMAENPIPFGLGFYGDGIFVSGTVKRFEKAMGKKVLSVNGIEMKEVIQKLTQFVPNENEYTVYKEGFNYLRFPAAFRMAGIAQNDTLVLTVENSQNQKEVVRVYPVNLKNSKDMTPLQTQQEKRDLRWQPPANIFTNNWSPEDSTLYIQYNRCISSEMALAMGDSISAMQLPPFQVFADSLIAFLQRTPHAKMLFDLRFNQGGNPDDILRLIERLKMIPDFNKKGKLFVATNLYTMGAAVQLAAQFGKETNAIILGEIPAGRPNQYTGMKSFALPNSKLQIYFPTKAVKPFKGDADTLKIDKVIPLLFEDFRMGKDPVLDYVRKQR